MSARMWIAGGAAVSAILAALLLGGAVVLARWQREFSADTEACHAAGGVWARTDADVSRRCVLPLVVVEYEHAR